MAGALLGVALLAVMAVPGSGALDRRSVTSEGKIAFDRAVGGRSSIYVMNEDGTMQRQLVVGDWSAAPAWSPDGQTIAYEHVTAGRNLDIYVVSVDGGAPQRLTRNPAIDGGPAWSPDGARIAFASTRAGGRRSVYVMSTEGIAVTGPLTSSPSRAGGPTWSPDGQKIAFWGVQRRIGAGSRTTDIYTIDVDVRNLRNLTRSTASDSSPAWSPNGRQIAFTRGTRSGARSGYDVYVMNADGSGVRNLTRSPGYDAKPTWSPDGKRIAFVSARDGNEEIYVMRADGAHQRRLTRNRVADRNPSWTGR